MKHPSRLSLLLSFLLAASASAADVASAPTLNTSVLGTRSIAACDPVSRACGVAVMSFPVTSSTVPYGKPGIAVASQMLPSVDEAQALMARVDAGETPQQALAAILAADPMPFMRQIGVVSLSADGTVHVAQHTGEASWTERCSVAGATYAVQAAGQTSAAVCQAMAQGFEQASGSFPLRLMAALKAGARVGQDTRGERSGTLRVWSAISPLSVVTHLVADASVSGKPDALAQLEGELYRYLGQVAPPDSADMMTLDAGTARRLKRVLRGLGYYRGPMDGRWNADAETGLVALQTNNVFFPRPTVGTFGGGPRKIDSALVQFILRADDGTLVPAY
ncbi:MAG: DUF1028 domain-containing protein [Myxococcaceae bacterium]|nr:DUF1028 domain-containing protein [Myxococcaceae bacterium]